MKTQGSSIRKIGFERPYTNDQVLSWIAEPSAAIIFYLVVPTFTNGTLEVVLLSTFTVLLVLHVIAWLICSLLDPAVDKGWAWPCMREAQKTVRYCAVCHKRVPGLDHHCTWLNTCIGKRQYPAFFALVLIGTVMYWMQIGTYVFLLTSGLSREVEERAVNLLGSLTTYKVLLSIASVFAGSLAIGFSILFSFHMFLQTQGMGTFGWLIEGRSKKFEKRTEAKAKPAPDVEEVTSEPGNCNQDPTTGEKVSTPVTEVSNV